MSKNFVCGYVIDFNDGGESEEQVLGRGSLEDCEYIGSLVPGVAYSGARPVKEARFVIVEDSEAK